MNIEKRNRFIKHLYVFFHTFLIKCAFLNTEAAGQESIIKGSVTQRKNQDNREYSFQVNVHKANDTIVRSYKQLVQMLQEALERLDAVDWKISRADLSFNSDDTEDYELFKKLMKLLICCIADAYDIRNCYKTSDLWTSKSLSVAVKSDTIEVENYDKAAESNNTSEVKTRLELRSKRMNKSLEQEFMGTWFERLDNALEHFEDVQNRYNRELLSIWQQDREKPEKKREFLSVTAFLMQFKDDIFTSSQLQRLLESMGIEVSRTVARHFKERHNIEFYSYTDLKTVIKALKSATRDYFCS